MAGRKSIKNHDYVRQRTERLNAFAYLGASIQNSSFAKDELNIVRATMAANRHTGAFTCVRSCPLNEARNER